MLREELLDLLARLREGTVELEQVECKLAQGGVPRNLAETIAAFANHRGGVILLGVGDAPDFPVVGINDLQRIQDGVANICAQELEPPVRPGIFVHKIAGATVLVVEIPEAAFTEKPVYIRGRGLYHGAYVRMADGDHQLTEYEVSKLLENRGQPRHDLEPVLEASQEDLAPELLADFIKRVRQRAAGLIGRSDEETILRSSRVLVEADGRLVPSLAGLLMFGAWPQTFFPNLRVVFLVYPHSDPTQPGPRGERYLVNESIEGNIPTMLEETMVLLNRHLEKRTIVTGAPRREELWEYPQEALREAIANALLHRDYAAYARGTQVQVALFPDRLQIFNPGGLYGQVTLENLDQLEVQQARNACLMRLAEDMGLVENRGGGIRAMIEATRRYGLALPRFDSNFTQFRVTFRNHDLLSPEALQWLELVGADALNPHQRLALVQARETGKIANYDYRRLSGVDMNIATRDLSDLVARGFLVAAGVRRWTTYVLAPKISGKALDARFQDLPEGSRDVWDFIRSRQPVARRDLIRHFQGRYSANQIDYRLEKLLQKGLVGVNNHKTRASDRTYFVAGGLEKE